MRVFGLCIFCLASGCAAAAGPPQRSSLAFPVTTQTEQVRVAPLPLARALTEFRTLCLNGFPDSEAFDQAAEASDLEFERTASRLPGQSRWSSRYGTLYLNTQRPMADGRPMIECDFRFLISEQLRTPELIARIENALAPGKRRREAAGLAEWDFGGDFADRLSYFPASDDLRYFSLNRRRIHEGSAR